jgi:branched-chain amino acid transport system ATP-binding protein
MLEIKNLNVCYGAIHALHDINLEVKESEIVTLIGANGAGKTSILRTISGLVAPKSGEILFKGNSLLITPAFKLIDLGICHVPEGRRIFANLSVMDNIELGAYTRKDKAGIKEDYEMVFKRFPRLKERRNQLAGTLSGGEQQMLAISRALMGRPKIILLDEPSMGLSPIFVEEIFNIIVDINKAGTTVLLVEQNAQMALSIADRAYVLETGRIVLSGDAEVLLDDDSVRSAYLGE